MANGRHTFRALMGWRVSYLSNSKGGAGDLAQRQGHVFMHRPIASKPPASEGIRKGGLPGRSVSGTTGMRHHAYYR